MDTVTFHFPLFSFLFGAGADLSHRRFSFSRRFWERPEGTAGLHAEHARWGHSAHAVPERNWARAAGECLQEGWPGIINRAGWAEELQEPIFKKEGK